MMINCLKYKILWAGNCCFFWFIIWFYFITIIITITIIIFIIIIIAIIFWQLCYYCFGCLMREGA